MEVFKQMFRDLRRKSKKQVIVASAFAVAVATAITFGLGMNASTSAAGVRDNSTNSLIKGGCLTISECTSKIVNNQPKDIQKIYDYFGLQKSEYDRFKRTARPAVIHKNGNVMVDGQKVGYDAWSTGRETFSGQRDAYTIPGAGKFYKSPTTSSFRSEKLDGFVMFDANGRMEFGIISACGNAFWGKEIVPKYSCDQLTKTAVAGKKDTYKFTAKASASNNAKIVNYQFNFGDGVTKTTTNPTIEHTFTKPGNYTITVKVLVSLPGKQTKLVASINCKETVKVLAPYYACTNLVATARDEKMQEFRFTTRMNYGNGAVPKNADFTVDGTNTTTGVTTKDEAGNFYKDYTFTDNAEHTVTAKIHFDVDGKDVVTTQVCKAKVQSKKTPMCIVPGKEHLPPNHPDCYEECKPGIPVGDERCNPTEECKPGVPVGSAECEEQPEMPATGAGSVVGLFAGTSILGAVGHRLFKSRIGRE